MQIKYLIFSFIFLLPFLVQSQTYQYKITAGNTDLGVLKASRIEKNGLIQIEVVSEVIVDLFISIDLKYKLNCTYKNNTLLFSSVTTYVNGKRHSTSVTQKNGNNYTITKDGHSSLFLSKINFSGALLYFIEPSKEVKIYSEFDNLFKSVKKVTSHNYEIKNPENGHLNKYEYINGILASCTINHTLLTFTITKQ